MGLESVSSGVTAAVKAITPAVESALPTAATVAADAAAAAAPAAVKAAEAVVRTGGSGGFAQVANWFGAIAGVAGLAVTALNTYKDTLGNQRNFDASSLFGGTGLAITGGAALLAIGNKAGTPGARTVIMGGGVAAIIGGLVGAVAGGFMRLGDPLKNEHVTTQQQDGYHFDRVVPPAVSNLNGVEIATGDVVTTARKTKQPPIYLDPTTTQAVEAGSTLAQAIGQARAAVQADVGQFRSQAVIQTADGAYWVTRTTGDLDQIDGPNYASGNDFDRRYITPDIMRREPGLKALVGVENVYVWPNSMSANDKAEKVAGIPWSTPQIPGVKVGG